MSSSKSLQTSICTGLNCYSCNNNHCFFHGKHREIPQPKKNDRSTLDSKNLKTETIIKQNVS